MISRATSNNAGVRLFNDNAPDGVGGNVLELIVEVGDEGSIQLPPGYVFENQRQTDDGGWIVGFGPPHG